MKYKTVTKLTNKGYEYFECPDGTKRWGLNGELHREDGPAIEYPDGSKRWYLNGKKIILETKSKSSKVKKLQDFIKIQEVLES